MGNPEELYESEEAKYLRLGADGIYYITAAEANREEVLARPRRELSNLEIIVFEWNDRVKRAEELKDRISVVYQQILDDPQSPSQYESDYKALWDQYRDIDLEEIDSQWFSEFRDKVAPRLKELGVKMNAVCDNWDPADFEDFEKLLASYEKNFDLSVALARGPVPKSKTHIASSPGEPLATTTTGEKYLSKREFSERFLWELTGYPKGVARDLLRECRNDIRFRGRHYAQRRWGRFIFLDKLTEIEHIPLSKTSTERKVKGSKFKRETYARELPVCDYGDGSVHWANCLPCPLYKDGHCLSEGGKIHRAVYGDEEGKI